MRVLVDLHGGDPDDVLAKAEFTEIKERVMFDVRSFTDDSCIPTDRGTARKRRRAYICLDVEAIQTACAVGYVVTSLCSACKQVYIHFGSLVN